MNLTAKWKLLNPKNKSPQVGDKNNTSPAMLKITNYSHSTDTLYGKQQMKGCSRSYIVTYRHIPNTDRSVNMLWNRTLKESVTSGDVDNICV